MQISKAYIFFICTVKQCHKCAPPQTLACMHECVMCSHWWVCVGLCRILHVYVQRDSCLRSLSNPSFDLKPSHLMGRKGNTNPKCALFLGKLSWGAAKGVIWAVIVSYEMCVPLSWAAHQVKTSISVYLKRNYCLLKAFTQFIFAL